MTDKEIMKTEKAVAFEMDLGGCLVVVYFYFVFLFFIQVSFMICDVLVDVVLF